MEKLLFHCATIPRSNADRGQGLKIFSVEGKLGRRYITDIASDRRFSVIKDVDVNGNFYHEQASCDSNDFRLYEKFEDAVAYHKQYRLYREYTELTRNQALRDSPVSVLETILCVLRRKDTEVQTEQTEPDNRREEGRKRSTKS